VSDGTHISWSDATWNPVTGCTKVSAGCDHCYIDRTPPFRMQHRRFDKPGIGGTTGVLLHPERLAQPLRWQKPRRIFVNSLSDLFHDSVPDEYLVNVFAVMAATPQHTYQVLTKRPARMRSFLRDLCRCGVGHPPGVHLSSNVSWALTAHNPEGVASQYPKAREAGQAARWPLPNVWLGVSTEDQKAGDLRIPILLETPAAVRWISAEPLLGPIDLVTHLANSSRASLDWVVTGGESGPGARPAHPDWFRTLRDQCGAAGVPFHFKQRGSWTWDCPTPIPARHMYGPDYVGPTGDSGAWNRPKVAEVWNVGARRAGRELDGITHDAYPAPQTAAAGTQ
jgi:protein gp37